MGCKKNATMYLKHVSTSSQFGGIEGVQVCLCFSVAVELSRAPSAPLLSLAPAWRYLRLPGSAPPLPHRLQLVFVSPSTTSHSARRRFRHRVWSIGGVDGAQQHILCVCVCVRSWRRDTHARPHFTTRPCDSLWRRGDGRLGVNAHRNL